MKMKTIQSIHVSDSKYLILLFIFAVSAVLSFICYNVYMLTSVISVVTRKPSNCTGLGLTISATSFTVKLSLTIIGTMAGIGYTLERKSLFYTLLYNLSFVSDWCACSWWNLSSNSRMVCTPLLFIVATM